MANTNVVGPACSVGNILSNLPLPMAIVKLPKGLRKGSDHRSHAGGRQEGGSPNSLTLQPFDLPAHQLPLTHAHGTF